MGVFGTRDVMSSGSDELDRSGVTRGFLLAVLLGLGFYAFIAVLLLLT